VLAGSQPGPASAATTQQDEPALTQHALAAAVTAKFGVGTPSTGVQQADVVLQTLRPTSNPQGHVHSGGRG
jgi:hypothetical protein